METGSVWSAIPLIPRHIDKRSPYPKGVADPVEYLLCYSLEARTRANLARLSRWYISWIVK